MLRRLLISAFVIAAALAAIYLAGPRIAADTEVTFDASAIDGNPAAFIAESEGKVEGIRDDLGKEIVWADPGSQAKTPLSIVYIHGFSASKSEIRPVPDEIAAELNANLFFTRLTGHAQDGAAMGRASLNDWINDTAEALAIGRAIGENVVVIATSTGGSLATWAATRPELMQDVAGIVLISPNYGIQASGAWLLTMPWGRQIAELVIGAERSFEPLNELHGKGWTTTYPVSALLPMAAATELARDAPVEEVEMPALFIFSDADRVVVPELTRRVAERWGGPHETMVVEGSDDPVHHVIAGDALSPSTNALVAGRVSQWISSLPR
ncbi:alpha/beta fold hydrolase [Aquamicrobium sp. LC103]|uniref:alpha/beta hydrolase n=1 Tax=Aquamicrobium sp. LC103 TaxID=1120658 RepID=UPI00063E8305|nr:alpha/beta fold hydrolase [Aquamicrobium sp. LC103]TKT76708.1 alpha/beta hydrolase [Aquamicrobium sp. LC103]